MLYIYETHKRESEPFHTQMNNDMKKRDFGYCAIMILHFKQFAHPRDWSTQYLTDLTVMAFVWVVKEAYLVAYCEK